MLSCIIRRHSEKQICSPNRLQLPKYKQSISNTQDVRLMEFSELEIFHETDPVSNTQDVRLMEFSELEIFHETDPVLLMKNNANSYIFF